MSGPDESFCPYVGLEPFEESHAGYFFGRRRDSKIIADHIVARPTTILYGPTGVGKTSLINVGLRGALSSRERWIVVVLRDWQDSSQFEQLAIDGLLAELKQRPRRHRNRIRFLSLVAWANRTTGRPIVIVLDQFEEYFRYRGAASMRELEMSISGIINRRRLAVRLLVSLREDALFELDRLRAYFPTILDTTIRLGHLSRWDVEEAIRGPIQHYNSVYRAHQKPIEVEVGLVNELIRQLYEAQLSSSVVGVQTVQSQQIELPYLQLTLKKIWESEGAASATTLHESTLTDQRRLGGVHQIVRDHVNLVMEGLSAKERDLCASIFDRLVTSIGSKIAYPTAALAAPSVVGPHISQAEVEATLRKLTPKESRILKQVSTIGGPGYEIFHDVLGLPILEWRQTHQTRRDALQWYSTRASTKNDAPSVLAITETIIAIFAYWWAAINSDTYPVLLASILLAPPFLLNSDKSEKLQGELFKRLTHQFPRLDAHDILAVSLLRFLVLETFRFAIRILSVLLNLREGLRELPRNFRRLAMSESILEPIEIGDQLPSQSWQIFALVATIPRSIYLLTLKSTVWFWWPLAFLASDPAQVDSPEAYRYRVLETLWGKFTIVSSMTVLVVFVAANLLVGSVLLDNPMLSPLGYFFTFNWGVSLWQIFPILLALLNLLLVFGVDSVGIEYRHARLVGDAALLDRCEAKFRYIRIIGRLRSILAALFFLVIGLYTLLYLNSRACRFGLPSTVERLAVTLYGDAFRSVDCPRILR